MTEKIHDMGPADYQDARGPQRLYAFHCPGCGYDHCFEVPRWSWNGSSEKPTFSPSLLCNKDYPDSRCHSFVVDGRIQFQNDCWHSFAGQTVDLPAWDDSPRHV